MCSISLWIDNNTPMYALVDTAWTRDRIFIKMLSHFMNFQKSVTLTMFYQFDQNTTLHTFNICFIRIWMDNNIPMYTLGDIVWTRGRIFLKFSLVFKVCHLTFFHQNERKHDVAHLPLMFYPYVKLKKNPLSTFGDMAWTRSRTDGRTDRRTDGKAETYIPSFHGG